MRQLAIVLLVAVVAALGAERPAQLLPVDESKSDQQLYEARTALLAALKDRSADSVMRYVSPSVVLEGEASVNAEGWSALFGDLSLSETALAGAKEHAYWRGLESALSLGGSFTTTRGAVSGRREFCAPYVYSAFPDTVPEDVRGETVPWVLVRANVEVRAEPSSSARVLKRLSYALLQAPGAEHSEPATGKQWKSVELPEGREGFVPRDTIWNPEGYHVCFAKTDARWLVSAFTSKSVI